MHIFGKTYSQIRQLSYEIGNRPIAAACTAQLSVMLITIGTARSFGGRQFRHWDFIPAYETLIRRPGLRRGDDEGLLRLDANQALLRR